MTQSRHKIWCVPFAVGFLYLGMVTFTAVAATANPVANRLDNWHGCGLLVSQGKQSYKSFFINERIYQYALEDLRDLRITDAKGEFVPYLIQNGYPINNKERTTYKARLIKSFRKQNNLTFDFIILAQDPNTDVMGNVLHLELPPRDFYKEAEVLGSYDGIHWAFLGRNAFFRVANLTQSDIALGAIEKYNFYRLTVLNNDENIAPDGLQLVFESNEADWRSFQRTAKLSYQIKNDAGLTRILIKNPRHLKIEQLDLDINENFKREYRVYRNMAKDAVPIAEGVIYHLKFQNHSVSNSLIHFNDNPASTPELIMEIRNYDDPPLKIDHIETVYFVDRIVFRDRGSGIYRVYFGNPDAAKPIYDLENYRSDIENEKTDQLTMKNIEIAKPGKAAAGEPRDYRLIFNIVIGAITILLVVLLIGRLNKST